MMTTGSKQRVAPTGARALLGAATGGLAVAVAAVVVGLVAQGGPAGAGALVGGAATLVVLAAGTWVVLRVAALSPMASLIAALVAFTVQGGLLLVTLAVLSEVSGDRQVTWAASAVIAVTVVWTTLFALYARKERIPLFDLSQPEADGVGAG